MFTIQRNSVLSKKFLGKIIFSTGKQDNFDKSSEIKIIVYLLDGKLAKMFIIDTYMLIIKYRGSQPKA